MAFVAPTVADFKSRFDRDFAFSKDQTDFRFVRDKDITLAFTQAGVNFNDALFGVQPEYAEAMLLLSAHFLCVNLTASEQGLGGAGQWLTNSKGIGGVSESFQIPPRIARSPFLSALSKTSYGMTYLTLILPLLRGNVVGLRREVSPA